MNDPKKAFDPLASLFDGPNLRAIAAATALNAYADDGLDSFLGASYPTEEAEDEGDAPSPVGEIGGWDQVLAARLAARLRGVPRAALYASPLARARQTAEALGDPLTLDDQLMELHQGELEGLDGPTAFARFPEVFAAWMSDPASAVIPGGEARGLAATLFI